VLRRPLVLLPVLLAGLALQVAPALAGEDDGGSPALHQVRDCLTHNRAKMTVTGDDIDSVAFYVGGKLRKTVNEPTSNGTYVFAMRCRQLSVGAHKARAVVSASDDTTTLRFTITRAAQASPRFTG
jgi:hypothetical protein